MAVIPRYAKDEKESRVKSMQGTHPFSSLLEDGTIGPIGNIEYQDYEEARNLRSMFFRPLESDRAFSLGQASGNFRLVDHAEALEPLLDMGFTPANLSRTLRGGARLFAVLQNPLYSIPDPIRWDGLESGGLTLSLALMADARVGHGFSITLGYFRMVCTNGLISMFLNLGHWSWSHLNFSPASLRDAVRGAIHQNFLSPVPKAPVMDSRVLVETTEVLRTLADPGYRDRWLARSISLIRDPLLSLENNLSAAGLEDLTASLERLSQSQGSFGILDLLNALTFAEKRSTRLYFVMDRVLRHLLKILELHSFKLGL